MDPVTIISTISIGLKLVDQFRELALRFKKEPVTPPGQTAEQSGDSLQVRAAGNVVQTIPANKVHLDQWDQPRYRALDRRIKTNWSLFNELFAENVGLSPEETARINVRLEKIKGELCQDFREMVRIYERALGTGLPDHYQLYEVCD